MSNNGQALCALGSTIYISVVSKSEDSGVLILELADALV